MHASSYAQKAKPTVDFSLRVVSFSHPLHCQAQLKWIAQGRDPELFSVTVRLRSCWKEQQFVDSGDEGSVINKLQQQPTREK
jgi:hypothetical protein